MNNKKIINIFAILLVIITCFSFSKVKAADFSSTLTRDNLTAYDASNFAALNSDRILGISGTRQSGDIYTWNPNTVGEAKTVWKIAEYSSDTSNVRDYSNLYYCLNAERGFGITNGQMAEGKTDTYTTGLDMKDATNKSNIANFAGGNLGTNYNKILWILENSYIPGTSSSEDKANLLKRAYEYRDKTRNFSEYLSNTLIDNDSDINITDEQIEVIQQLAIWHFTNGYNVTSDILYKNGNEIDGLGEKYDVGGYGVYYVTTGEIIAWKMEALYNYFIQAAPLNYVSLDPTLSLSNVNTEVKELKDSYIIGPLSLTGTNTDSIKEIEANVNIDYTLLFSDSSEDVVSNNDFTKVIDNDFYLKIAKNKITTSTQIEINLTYKYDTRTLTFFTDANDAINTQSVVLVENEEDSKDIIIEIPITLTGVSVEKIWNDNNNQDGKRPTQLTVQLYKGEEEYGNAVTLSAGEDNIWQENELTYTWTKLLSGYTYTVKELNKAGKKVEHNGKFDNNYTATYELSNNKTTITNTYTPKTINISGTKTWEDNNNQDGKRPDSITVNLLANGTEVKEVIVTEQDNWEYTFSDLPEYENGEEINYTITEDIVNDYTTTINGYNITNKYTPGKINLKVNKVWDDQENQDKIRPTSVQVQLYKTTNETKEKVGEEITLNEENNWTYTWSELDEKYNGKTIIYSIKEKTVENYTTTYSSQDYSNTNEITITNSYVPVEITGKYNVVLRKVDENGNILNGSTFEMNDKVFELSAGEVAILQDAQIFSEDDIILPYEIKETVIPAGYNGITDKQINIKAEVKKEEDSYKITGVQLVDEERNTITDEDISLKVEENTIVIVVKNTPIEKKFDLALRKFITKINDIEYSRQPVVDTSKLGLEVDGKVVTTATYKHSKEPIAVQKGDIVTYTIRVYNEGELDGYVDKITDYLPDNLVAITNATEGIDTEKYAEEIEFNANWGWVSSEDGKSVTTMKTAKVNSDTYSLLEGYEDVTDTKLDAYVEGSNELDYIDVQIKCLVTENTVSGEYLTNIAEITESQDINGVQGDGIDSQLSNVDYSNLSDYKNQEAINSTTESYVEGQEDDDDFEKLVVKEFDLALRKFITKVNETSHSREPQVDTSKLGTIVNDKTITTAIYNHTKAPVIVETEDLVTYTIRIFNEGTLAGFANEITDDIPEGLEFLPNSDVNIEYKWEMLDSEGNVTEDVSKAVMIVTEYLSDENKNNEIPAVSEVDGIKTLSYKDVQVQFKVIAKAENLKDNIIINEAQISADSDRDIDSVPNRNEKYDYINGNNEDDIDYEPIKLQYFDLALRKFITKVNSIDYNNRYPEIKYNEDGSITYNHTKDPVLVTTNDTVIYTIRIYNEGDKAGYATEIKDNLPDGLAFDPENEINKQYIWKMLDSEGNETTDASKVVAFSTDYLKNEIIDAFIEKDGQKVLSYKDVKIAFKVVEPNTSDRILVNTAQILQDSDDDIDSIPGNDILTEDDIDKEYVRVQYFDLSLKKWVTASKVTYNGKTTTTKTGFDEDSEGIAKVDLVASKMSKTTVKFVYNIKITNEGELPGYAYEVKDYIPKGLKFVADDNKDWKELEDGTVVTDKLKDTLLNPGESATVEIVLTWKNSTTNMGLKTNYAEISNDSSEDIDSIPDNYDFTEDDIDDAQVILSIKTSGAPTYIGLVLATVAILAGGIFIIKKYVID